MRQKGGVVFCCLFFFRGVASKERDTDKIFLTSPDTHAIKIAMFSPSSYIREKNWIRASHFFHWIRCQWEGNAKEKGQFQNTSARTHIHEFHHHHQVESEKWALDQRLFSSSSKLVHYKISNWLAADDLRTINYKPVQILLFHEIRQRWANSKKN